MFCKNCGKRLGEDAKFCGGCGTPVSVPTENNTIQPEPVQEAVQSEPVQEIVQPEPIQEAVQLEPMQETVQPEPVQEAVQSEPVQEIVQPEPVQEAVQSEPVHETVQPEPVQEAVQSEPVQEIVQPEPVQEAVQSEPVQEIVQPEPVQEAVQSEPVQEAAQPISAVISQMSGAQKADEPASAEPTAEAAQPVPEAITEEVPKNPLPESFSEAVGEQAAAKPKKKKGKVGLIIGGTAVILAGAVAAVGYFCFSNQIMRLIKGDAGYAKVIELKSYSDYILGGEELDFGIIDNAIASNIETALTIEQASKNSGENSELISILNNTSSLDNLLETYGDSEIKITADVEFYSFFKAILGENDSINEYLDMLRSTSFISRVQGGENGNKYTTSAQFKDSDIFRMEQYHSDDLTALTVPDFCDYTFYIKGETGEDSITVPREEIARIRTEMYRIFEEAYPSAEFTYTDGEFTVAGTQVKGTEVKTVFSEELCGEILDQMGAFLKNDEFMRSFYISATGNDISEYEEMFSEPAKAEKRITICNYIAPHTEIIGKTIIVTDLSEDDESVAVGIVNNKDEIRFIMDTPDGGQLSVISTSDTETSLLDAADVINTEITFLEDKDSKPLVLDLRCENPGKVTYCGKTIRTGKYTLSLSDKDELFISEFDKNENGISGEMMSLNDSESSSAMVKEALKCAKIGWNIDGDENKLNCGFSFNITSMLSFTVNTELTPYSSDEAFSMPDISGEKCINLSEDIDEKTQNAIKLNISEKTLEAIGKNDILRDIADKTGLADNLEKAVEEMKRSERMLEHYSAYTSSSSYEARRCARHIYDSFTEQFWEVGNNLNDEELEKYSILNDGGIFTEPRTIKIYFGEQGAEVIDDGGIGFVDFSKLIDDSDKYKNMYCELTFDFEHALSFYLDSYSYENDWNIPVLTGVCVVYTDDPGDLPSVLPNTYNYIDSVFEWGGEQYYKDDFVVGTYPQLDEGISTSGYEEEKFKAEKEQLDDYALTIAKAVTVFVRQNPDLFELDDTEAFSLELESGSWSILNAYDGTMLQSGKIAMQFAQSGLTKHLKDIDRLNNIAGIGSSDNVRVQLLFARESYYDSLYQTGTDYSSFEEAQDEISESEMKLVGAAVVNSSENVVFSDYYVPAYYDYIYGSFYNWSFNSAYSYPTAGKLYLTESYYIPFGSWCASTGTALTTGY